MLIECLHDKFRGHGSSARGRSRLREHNECNAAREKLRKAQTRDDASERTNTRGCGRGSQVGFPQLPQNRKYQESFQFGSTLVEQRAWDGCPMAHGGHTYLVSLNMDVAYRRSATQENDNQSMKTGSSGHGIFCTREIKEGWFYLT